MRIPNAERTFIDMRKLSEYALDPTHPAGGDKAIVFKSALGFTVSFACARARECC
jgi:hypothetical protein